MNNSSFSELYRRSRYFSRSRPNSETDKKEMRRLEEFATAALAFVLRHDDGFKREFLKRICRLKGVIGDRFEVEVQSDHATGAGKFGQDYPTFVESAWDGLVKLHAYRGLLQANVAFDSAKENIFSEDDGLMLPGNSAGRCAWVERTFRRYAKHLARVIPAKERWRFGR